MDGTSLDDFAERTPAHFLDWHLPRLRHLHVVSTEGKFRSMLHRGQYR
jgi:hypothetical protein